MEELPPHEMTPEALERLQGTYLLHVGVDPFGEGSCGRV